MTDEISYLFYFFLSLFFPFSCRLALSSKALFTPPTPWWSLPTPSNPLSPRASWSSHCSTLNCRLPTTLRKDQGMYNIWFKHLGRHLCGQHIVPFFVVSLPSVPRDWGSVWVKVIQGGFFNWPSPFSVPKWKTSRSQPGQPFQENFNVKKLLIGWASFFILALKMGRAS